MTTTHADKLANLFARTSTPALVVSALTLDAMPNLDSDHRMARAWTCDEIERRMGGVQDDGAFDALLDEGLSYTECLIATFPALAQFRL